MKTERQIKAEIEQLKQTMDKTKGPLFKLIYASHIQILESVLGIDK